LPQSAEGEQRLQAHLLARGRDTIIRVHHRLLEIRQQPEWDVLRQYFENRAAEIGTDTTFPDRVAETTAFQELQRPQDGYRDVVLLPIGEELMKEPARWPPAGLRGMDPSKKIVALVDPLDGTKLEAREIPTWCIALVFYAREPRRILASTVGQATGSVYFATPTPITNAQLDNEPKRSDGSKSATAWRQIPKPDAPREAGWFDLAAPEPLNLLVDTVTDHKHVHVAFVAPTPVAFLWASRFVQKAHSSDPTLMGRVYNMGGNPMLAKIADGTIDAVVGFGDMEGPTKTRPQKPHDYVPGAFIACQAGATAIDIDTGKLLDFESPLLQPDQPGRRYIVARTARLAERCLAPVRAAEEDMRRQQQP